LDGNAASDDLSCRPVKISYSPRTDADKSLYDITATVTLRDDKMQRFWLFRTVPEVLDLARKSDRERCRELGKRLDAIGGFTLMLTVGEFVQMSSNEARMFVERIAWKDVGMWRG
jgi:hypothetical protein